MAAIQRSQILNLKSSISNLYFEQVKYDPRHLARLIHRLESGSIHSLVHHETFHPVIGPVAEAEALYVNQLQLRERLRNHSGEFVIWDVGLGAAANALTVLRATRDRPCPLRLVSFDCTIEPLKFALQHAAVFGYFLART